jgi:hypothetical protein
MRARFNLVKNIGTPELLFGWEKEAELESTVVAPQR